MNMIFHILIIMSYQYGCGTACRNNMTSGGKEGVYDIIESYIVKTIECASGYVTAAVSRLVKGNTESSRRKNVQ